METKTSRLWLLAALMAILTGCSPYGYVYHHTTQPLDTSMDQTPTMFGDPQEGDIKHFSYNVVDLSIGSNGIGEIARTRGIETIYFADIETLRILGIWEQTFVHVYGK